MSSGSGHNKAASSARIHLLGGFAVRLSGLPVNLGSDAERLIAFVSLQDGPVPRVFVAGSLWPDGTQDRAFGNLRSALWRLRGVTDTLINVSGQSLALLDEVAVDLREAMDASRTLDGVSDANRLPPIETFTRELLPGWYDEWVLIERERHRQRSMHALESLARQLTITRRYGAAIEAALAAIEVDPLRESAHRHLIEIHLAEGNLSEALRHYDEYRQFLFAELGIEPSPLFKESLGKLAASA